MRCVQVATVALDSARLPRSLGCPLQTLSHIWHDVERHVGTAEVGNLAPMSGATHHLGGAVGTRSKGHRKPLRLRRRVKILKMY
jgi:hypothetical protein